MKLASAKKKGRKWEQAIAGYLSVNGFPDAERRRLAGVQDKGDIAGVPGVMIEAKNEAAAPSVGAYMTEVRRQMVNANASIGVAWVKRPGAPDAGRGVVLADEAMLARLGFLGDVVNHDVRLPALLMHEELFAPRPGPRVLVVKRNSPYLNQPVVAMSGQLFVQLLQPVENLA